MTLNIMRKFLNAKWMIAIVALLSSVAFSSCGDDDDDNLKQDPQKMIVGRWICYDDAYGDPWDEPLEYVFNSDGTGYGWFQEEPFSYRWEFTYTIMESKIRFKEEDDTYNLRYTISSNGKTLVLYGFDDNDMEELHFVKQ